MTTQTLEIKQEPAQQVETEIIYGLPVNTTVLFSDHKGIYKKRIEKYQLKLLTKLYFLEPFLEPGEKILHVTSGCSPISFLEQLLKGAILYFLKQSLFVVTDRRILHIPTTPDLSYRCSIAQILYADCNQLRMRGSTLIAKYKSGRTEKFPCIHRRGKKKIKVLLGDMSFKGRTSEALERTHLCPRCTFPLINHYYSCPKCSLEFKSRPMARTLSILLPGGGYFYTRHPLFGALNIVMETLFVLLLTVLLIVFSMDRSYQPRSFGYAIAMCVMMLVFEKAMMIMHCGKFIDEFIPKQRHVILQNDLARAQQNSPELENMLCSGWRSR